MVPLVSTVHLIPLNSARIPYIEKRIVVALAHSKMEESIDIMTPYLCRASCPTSSSALFTAYKKSSNKCSNRCSRLDHTNFQPLPPLP